MICKVKRLHRYFLCVYYSVNIIYYLNQVPDISQNRATAFNLQIMYKYDTLTIQKGESLDHVLFVHLLLQSCDVHIANVIIC